MVVLAALTVAACPGATAAADRTRPRGRLGAGHGRTGDAARRPPRRPTLRTFTVVTTGDFLLHMPVQRQALAYGGGTHDFAPMLAEIAGEVSAADLALCHMETPISSDNSNLPATHLQRPREIADAVADAGYDACSTASNHSLDQGATASRRPSTSSTGSGSATSAPPARPRRRPPPTCTTSPAWPWPT